MHESHPLTIRQRERVFLYRVRFVFVPSVSIQFDFYDSQAHTQKSVLVYSGSDVARPLVVSFALDMRVILGGI